MKSLAILYSLYDHQFFTPYNLEHVYDDVDQIIIAYGPFKYYPEIKKKILGYDDDNTLDIIKWFIKENDVDNKIKLIIQDEWENYYAKRVEVQKHIEADFFFNIGPDEFFEKNALLKIKNIINEYHEVINAVYHPRIEFCHDFRHYWGTHNIDINKTNSKLYNEYGDILKQAKAEKKIIKVDENYSALPFYNRPVLWNMNDMSVIMTVSGYKNEDGLYWEKDDIDTNLYHFDGTPFDDLNITYFGNDIIRHHYFTAQEPELHFLQRAVYYNKVRQPEKDIDDLIIEKKGQYKNWNQESIKNMFFSKNSRVRENGPFEYKGEYPTVIKHHPCFWKKNI
jgi:hypothetical protein